MAVLKNRAKMSTSTTGTGTITLGSAESGYQTFADAGVANADVVRYIIEDGNNFEIGTGTYTSSGTTLSRTVSESSNSNNAINLSGSATVFIGATAEDIPALYAENTSNGATAPIATGNDSVSLGSDANSSGTDSIAIMNGNASGLNSLAAVIGNNTTTYGAQASSAISIGILSKATVIAGTSFGYGAISTHSAANAFGTFATTTANNQIALGGSGFQVRISGAYTLPTSDGTNGQVLTTDGSGAVTFADAGGGGADLYIANPVSATDPTAAGDNAVGIGDGADATGNDSIAIGTGTIAGLDSVAIGLNAASGTTTGSYNTSIGRSAAIYLTTGSNNLAVGRSALQGSNLDKVTGSGNAAIGYGAGSSNAGGNNNTYLGTDAGNAITSGSSNTFIGYNADGAASTSQQTALGYQAQTAGTEAIAIGNSRAGGIGTFAAQIGTNSSSYGAIGNSGTAIGGLTKTTGLDFVFGRSSIASGGSGSLSLGMDNTSSGAGAVTLGKDNTASHTDAVVIGQGASSSAADQITLGHTDQTVRISSAYTLPQADGSANQVLQTNGSGQLSFAAAAGGGSPDLYSENYTSGTKPTATGTNAVAIGQGSQASGSNSTAIGYESAATQSNTFAAAISGGLSYAGARAGNSIAMGYRSTTNNLGSVAIGYTASASGNYSIALGNNARTGGTEAIALGKSRADGADSFAAAITNNTSSYGATGASSIAMGYHAKASANYAFAQGYESQALGNSDVALGYQAQANQGVALGYKGRATASRAFGVNNNTNGGATGSSSTAIGDSCLASGTGSVAIGFAGTADAFGAVAIGRTPNVNGIRKLAYAVTSLSGNYDGSSQTGIQVLSAATTDATATALAAHGTASTDNQVILPNNSAYAFHGTIVARQQAADGTACAAWKVEGLIRREANAGTTVLVNSATTVLDNTPSWGMALSADTTNGGLAITCTGAASTDIRWVATIHTSEVTYA